MSIQGEAAFAGVVCAKYLVMHNAIKTEMFTSYLIIKMVSFLSRCIKSDYGQGLQCLGEEDASFQDQDPARHLLLLSLGRAEPKHRVL